MIKINYTSNIKFKHPNLKKIISRPRILFNRRFLFLFFLFNLELETNKLIYRILYKPRKFNKFNILRAPYKNKIAQNSYAFYRYNVSLYLETESRYSISSDLFFFLLKLFKRGFLASNVTFVKSINIIKYYKLKI